jgi:hypothetical protein
MGLTPAEEQLVQKRVPDNTCARCRRKFQIGDRLTWAFILINPDARNPNRITERGLELGTDTEFAHVDCTDPTLSGKNASRILVPT